MSAVENNPLDESHYQQIVNGLARIKLARQQIAMAKQAGIPVGALEQQTNDTEAKLLQLKQTYFPGR